MRRKTFTRILGAGLVGAAMPNTKVTKPRKIEAADLKLGLASYTLREFDLDQVLEISNRLGLQYLCLKSMHLPLDSSDKDIEKISHKIRSAGLDLYGAGVIYMNSGEEVENAFRYAGAADLKVIIGVPKHELLPLVEEKVKETNIKLAIHNHGPGDDLYPTPAVAYELIKHLDERIGLCIDIGHVKRLNLDPVDRLKKYADRLYDIHLKDVDKPEAEGSSVEIGRGIINIGAVLKMLDKIKYQGVMGLEYEKDGKDPLAGLAESVGYVRGVRDMI